MSFELDVRPGPPWVMEETIRADLIVTDGRIEHAFYPVFPPDGHAAEVLEWLRKSPVG